MLIDPVDRVDMINGEFDEFQEELLVRNKKLRLLVSFPVDDDIISLLSDISKMEVIL